MRKLFTFLLLAVAAFGTAQFKVDPQKIPIVQKKRRALIIGASDYQSLGKLKFAHSDAERFRDALIQGFGFTNDSIRLVTDSPENPIKPVAKTILGELDKMLMDPILDKGDMFILYFSGHGMATAKGDYLCSTDSTKSNIESTGLPVTEVVQRLVKAKLRNVVIIADACRAGEKNEFGSELFEQARKANIAVMLGCSPGQKSYEAPSLRSGAFTYFLLKALGNPKNRTESGGLWMSRIATSVQNSVLEYTKHDYGDNAQRPRSFADPTSDVMLAKFVNRTQTNEKNEDLEMVPDRAKISDQMVEIGLEQIDRDDYLAALESNKQSLTLNPDNLYAAYYASISTMHLGRSGEHEKFCDMLKKSPNPYFRNLGFVQSDSRATPIAERVKSLEAYWESSPKDEIHAIIVWGKARTYLPLALTKTLIQKMLPSMSEGTRIRKFFEGEVAVADRKLEAALLAYRTAIKIPDAYNYINEEMLTVLQFPLLRQLKREEELKSILRSLFTKDKVSPLVWVTGASNLKEMGLRDAAIAIVKKGIKEPGISELEAVMSSMIMGASLPEIADDLEAIQKKMPYSWKIRTVALVARALIKQDVEAAQKAFEEASLYCDDEVEIASLTYSLEISIFDDAEKYLGIPPERFSEARELFRLMFFNMADRLGTDSEKWFQLGEVGIVTLQGPDTLRLFKHYLKDFNANSELGSEFYVMLFQLAASVEDDQLAKFAVNHPALAEPDRTDVLAWYAAYLVSRGDYVNGSATFASVGEVSETNKIVKLSLDAIFKARTGDLTVLRKFLSQKFGRTEAELVAQGIAALALSDLGKNDEAFEHLTVFINHQPSIIASVPLRCVERYLQILKSNGKVAEADATLFEMLKINRSSPAIMASYFGSKPEIENYIGHFSAETKWVTDENYDAKNPTHKNAYQTAAIGGGQFEMTVGKDGIVKGTIKVLDGEIFELTGSVDKFGNLRAKAKSNLHLFDVEAKLIGNEFKKTEAFQKSSIGQMINVFNDKGLVTHWMLPASVVKP